MQKRGASQWPMTSAGKSIVQQHTAAEIEAMSPEEAMDVRHAGGSYQRGVPESKMLAYQRLHGGGVMPTAVEHVGDLTHRMNEDMPTSTLMEAVSDKIDKQGRNLNSRYGFAKEHQENIEGNARYDNVDPSEFAAKVGAAGQEYADAHKKVPVYNYPSEVARSAAVNLGEGRFGRAAEDIDHLSAMHTGGRFGSSNYAAGDLATLISHPRRGDAPGMAMHKQGMVDYLRGKEAETPEFTDAATVMLGGRLRR
jgi:hypothetical protein